MQDRLLAQRQGIGNLYYKVDEHLNPDVILSILHQAPAKSRYLVIILPGGDPVAGERPAPALHHLSGGGLPPRTVHTPGGAGGVACS